MKIWIVKTSEMLADDSDGGRLLRSGIVAKMLDQRGHEVTWWVSTFDHAKRRQRTSADSKRAFGSRGTIRLVHSPGYQRSISLARLWDHAVWGRRFYNAICQEPRPDAIVCAYPTIESAYASVRYGRRLGVPVAVDLRDMWPDIQVASAPAAIRPLAIAALAPWRWLGRSALKDASALFAITDEFLDWGLQYAGRARGPRDATFPLAYFLPSTTPDEAAERFWDERGVRRDDCFNIVVIGGALAGRGYRMDAVLRAAEMLDNSGPAVRIIVCGHGDGLEELRQQARARTNTLFPGWITAPQIRALLLRAHLGLVPYRNTPDYVISVPNKAAEYLSAGIPVGTSLRGTLQRVLSQNGCGFAYDADDPATLVAQVRRLQHSPFEHASMCERARALFERDYRAEDVYGRYVACVERLVEVAGPAGTARTDATST